jgi:hypothetical protein
MDPRWIEDDKAAWNAIRQQIPFPGPQAQTDNLSGHSDEKNLKSGSHQPGVIFVQRNVQFSAPPTNSTSYEKTMKIDAPADYKRNNQSHLRTYRPGEHNLLQQQQDLPNSSYNYDDSCAYCEINCYDTDSLSQISDISDDPIDKFHRHAFSFAQPISVQNLEGEGHSYPQQPCTQRQKETNFTIKNRAIIKSRATTFEAISAGCSASAKCNVCHLNMQVVDIAVYVLCERCKNIFKR